MSAAKRLFALGAVITAMAACSDTTNPLAGTGQNVSLSFAGRTPGASGVLSAAAAGDSMVIAVGSDTLILKSVELVLRRIEMERANVTVNCDSISDSDPRCEEFTTGELLVQLPLAAGAATAFTIPVDSGTFSKAKFEIHKPGNDSIDLAFKAANPTWPANTSIRVTGTFNHSAFTYVTSLDVSQETAFVPPLVINASGTPTNLTLRADVSVWFKTAGGALISPATANNGQPNQSTVENNIKNSFKSFKDENKDGNESNG